MARARKVALAFTQRKPLPLLFRTNALALGHVLTERDHERVVRQRLSGPEAEACYDQQARQALHTVNLYLGLVADVIKEQEGIFDKFIGDCVTAFWGAPAPHPQHALACVRAAIKAQRAIHDLNRQRAEENARREAENQKRQADGLPPEPLLLKGFSAPVKFYEAPWRAPDAPPPARATVITPEEEVAGVAAPRA